MSASARVVVVVLNYNGGRKVVECVGSLVGSCLENSEIVVVDNASTDGSTLRLKQHFRKVTVLENDSNLGYAGGNNVGIEYALSRGADFVLVMNNDVIVVNPHFLKELVEFADAQPRAGIIGPKVFIHECGTIQNTICSVPGTFQSLVSWFRQRIRLNAPRSGNLVQEAPVLNGVCVLLRAEMLNEIGSFDFNIFMYREDTDLALRARDAGWKSFYVPVESVVHVQKQKGYDFVGMVNFLLKRNAVYVLKKHGRVLDAWGVATASLVLTFARALAATLQRRNATLHWEFLGVLLISIASVLKGATNCAEFGPPYRDWRDMVPLASRAQY